MFSVWKVPWVGIFIQVTVFVMLAYSVCSTLFVWYALFINKVLGLFIFPGCCKSSQLWREPGSQAAALEQWCPLRAGVLRTRGPPAGPSLTPAPAPEPRGPARTSAGYYCPPKTRCLCSHPFSYGDGLYLWVKSSVPASSSAPRWNQRSKVQKQGVVKAGGWQQKPPGWK